MRKQIFIILVIFIANCFSFTIVNAAQEKWEYIMSNTNGIIYYLDENPDHIIFPTDNIIVFDLLGVHRKSDSAGVIRIAVKYDENSQAYYFRWEGEADIRVSTWKIIRESPASLQWFKLPPNSIIANAFYRACQIKYTKN